jgi:hypothetical protein
MPTTLKNILVFLVAVLLSFSLSAQMLKYKIPQKVYAAVLCGSDQSQSTVKKLIIE